MLLVMTGPFLIWCLLRRTDAVPPLRPFREWLEVMRLRSSQLVFALSWNAETWLCGLLLIVVFVIARRHRPKVAEHHRFVICCALTVAALGIAGIVFAEFIPLGVALQWQLFRSSKFFACFTILCVANFWVVEANRPERSTGLLLAPALGFAVRHTS